MYVVDAHVQGHSGLHVQPQVVRSAHLKLRENSLTSCLTCLTNFFGSFGVGESSAVYVVDAHVQGHSGLHVQPQVVRSAHLIQKILMDMNFPDS